MDELREVLQQFGSTGLWGVVIYKGFETIQLFGSLFLVGWGIKKAWPSVKKFLG